MSEFGENGSDDQRNLTRGVGERDFSRNRLEDHHVTSIAEGSPRRPESEWVMVVLLKRSRSEISD